MIYVPPGRFLFGSADSTDLRRGFLNAPPVHEVQTDGCYISRYEVIDVTYGRDPLAFGPDEVGSHPASRSPIGADGTPLTNVPLRLPRSGSKPPHVRSRVRRADTTLRCPDLLHNTSNPSPSIRTSPECRHKAIPVTPAEIPTVRSARGRGPRTPLRIRTCRAERRARRCRRSRRSPTRGWRTW